MHPSRMEDIKTASEAPTRNRLVEAAAAEFNAVGFHGTNTNKIAKAAGFSPQTFYRHFEDKVEIFLAVYDGWQASERHAVTRALKSSAAISVATGVVLIARISSPRCRPPDSTVVCAAGDSGSM